MSRKVFRDYMDLLVAEGLVHEVRESKVCRYFATDALRETQAVPPPALPKGPGDLRIP